MPGASSGFLLHQTSPRQHSKTQDPRGGEGAKTKEDKRKPASGHSSRAGTRSSVEYPPSSRNTGGDPGRVITGKTARDREITRASSEQFSSRI